MSVKRYRRSRTLSITLKKYLEGVLKGFDMENGMPVSTRLEQGRKFKPVRYDKMKMMSWDIKWQLDV